MKLGKALWVIYRSLKGSKFYVSTVEMRTVQALEPKQWPAIWRTDALFIPPPFLFWHTSLSTLGRWVELHVIVLIIYLTSAKPPPLYRGLCEWASKQSSNCIHFILPLPHTHIHTPPSLLSLALDECEHWKCRCSWNRKQSKKGFWRISLLPGPASWWQVPLQGHAGISSRPVDWNTTESHQCECFLQPSPPPKK